MESMKILPGAWNSTGLNLYRDRIRANLGVDDVELLNDVVHNPFHSLLARVNVTHHLEQLVAIVEVVQKGDSVTEMGCRGFAKKVQRRNLG